MAQTQLGRYQAAVTSYEKALGENQDVPIRWIVSLANAYRDIGDTPNSLKVLENALRREPSAPLTHQALEALASNGRASQVFSLYGTLIESMDSPDAFLVRSSLELASRHPEAASSYLLDVCADAVLGSRLTATTIELWFEARKRLGEIEQAFLAVEAISADPSQNIMAGRMLGRLAQEAVSRARFADAIDLNLRALEHLPLESNLHYNLGRAALLSCWWGPGASTARFSLPKTIESPIPASELAAISLERAILLRPKNMSWLSTLADAREACNYKVGVLAACEHFLAVARSSDSQQHVRRIHEWEFRYEYAQARAGAARVTDTLFDIRLHAVGDHDRENNAFGGFARGEVMFTGLRLSAVVHTPRAETVKIFLDEYLLREERLGGQEGAGKLSLDISRSTLGQFPHESHLRFETDDGKPLQVDSRGAAYMVSVPHGSAEIGKLLAAGHTLDKKGRIPRSLADVRNRQDEYLRLYHKVRDFLFQELGLECFVLYGTLLGLHRSGDFIPNDDDFDCGYVSGADDPLSVKEEARNIIGRLILAGFVVSFNHRGRLFRISGGEGFRRDVHLDIRPIWFSESRVWMHNHVSYEATPADFLPARSRKLRSTTVYVPRHTERFLEEHYGPGWRFPDPSFTYYADEVDSDIRTELSRALITPVEYHSWRQAYEDELGPAVAQRFISVAELPLYPLSDLIN